jgi:hypothetical protein
MAHEIIKQIGSGVQLILFSNSNGDHYLRKGHFIFLLRFNQKSLFQSKDEHGRQSTSHAIDTRTMEPVILIEDIVEVYPEC